MASTHSRAHSAPKTRQEKKKNTRRFGFNSSGAEWLEQRLLLTADLSVSKSQIAPLAGGVPAAVVAGEMVSYQITVANSNAATSSATNTTLTDTLPAGETLINASAASGGTLSVSGNSFTENLGTIGAGSTVTVTIDALVNGQVGGTLTNTASVSSPDENGGLPIVSAPVSTTINALTNSAPSLSITKTAATGDAAISAGAGETYTITVANNSANAASNVNVLDVLPAGATFLTGTVTGGTGATVLSPPTGNLETIDLGTLAGHGSATISLAITGPASVGAMINTATVESGSGNSAVASATDSVATAVQGTTTPPTGTVDLSIAKVVTASGSAGTSQTETITVKNQGTANATGVVIADMLPGGAQFISGTASVNGVAVTANNGMASAQLPTLAAGASATLTLTLTPSIVGALTDTAYVEADQVDANQANNIATATSLVTGLLTPAVDLSVTESASAATGSVGANEVYTITVTNNSANAATGVALSDTLPANALFIGATSSTGATLNPSLGTLTDQIGNLAAGASQTLTVTVTPTVAGVLTNAAYVAGSQLDTNLANNVATLTTPVQGVVNANVDLSITKTAANSNASVAVGANETYTLTVTNNGTAAATGVVISDVLPAAATFLGGSTSINGTTVADLSGTATTNLGTLAAGASATVTITVTPTVAGSITDTAYVESNDVDTNQANNSASVTTPVISPTSAANLSIAKIATPNPDVEGQPLTYVLLITNTGAAAADNVNVSDTLPSGLTFVSASTDVNGVTVNNSNGTLTANLGTVPIGAVDTITVVVTPTSPGSITNTASVSTTTPNLS
ncbi:MAG TPA: DUF11 domain-containing protein, partial [Pirellulales bacterium]|nr:DUF11 domain-containing protein [Pirellulales bacterium]